MKVSVVTIAYNQEKYITQAVESVLAQQCDFEFEYIIGDDASTDRTAEILRDYQLRYPEQIRLTTRDRNVGAQQNLADMLAMCTGQYVALLDGDDYWTSARKLQTQVDFMDEHPDCALCFHNVQVVDEWGHLLEILDMSAMPPRAKLEDLLTQTFISACTVMYRWGLVDALPDWWNDTWIGDYPLHMLHAQHGWIGYIDELMAVYRRHGGGLWSGQRAAARTEEFITTLQRLDETLGFKYHDSIQRSVYAYRFGDGGGASTVAHVRWLLWNLRWRGDIPLNAVAVVVVRSIAPWLVEPLVAGKRFLRRLADRLPRDTST